MNKYELISFDIFDTLISRRVAKPTDVFYLIESFLAYQDEWICFPNLINSFTILRVKAEKVARNEKINKTGGEPEILIEDIYRSLANLLPELDEDNINKLIDIEISFEKAVLFKSYQAESIFNEAMNSGAKIAIISDMYLPSSTLRDLLIHCGYNTNNITIFSSGEEGISKHSGKLYSLVQEKLRIIDKRKWLHIGDNKHADIYRAKEFGIETKLANWSFNNHEEVPHWLVKDIIGCSIRNFVELPQAKTFYNDSNILETIGFKIFGPLLLGYISWFIHLAKEANLEKLVFLARDAHLIQKLYIKYFQSKYYFEHEYMYISRATAYKMGLTDWPMHRIWSFFGGKNRKSLKQILNLFNLTEEEYELDIKEVGFPSSEYKPSNNDAQKVHWLVNKLYMKILNKSKIYREEYISYFENIFSNSKNIGIVDIGWAGNIQSVMVRALSEKWIDRSFYGLYLATFENAKVNESIYNKMSGWLTNNGFPEDRVKALLSGGVELLELAMADNTGSTKDYYKDKDGNVIPVREIVSESEKVYLDKASQLQNGIMSFFDYISPLIKKLPLESLNSIFLADPFMRLIQFPQYDEIESLADITHSEAAGDNTTRLELAKKIDIFSRLSKNEGFKHALDNSYWKEAFKMRNRRKFWKYK